MKKMNLMLVREILKSKGQFIAATMVVFAGITLFTTCFMSYNNLKNSMNFYYEKYNFLDYYAEANNISPNAIEQVKKLDGVKSCIGRISKDICADMSSTKRITLRLVSLPDDRQPNINKVVIVAGNYFNQKAQNGCLINKNFADINNFRKGDTVKAVINEQVYEFTINGIVESPEFIYTIKSAASIFPSADDFGILFVKESYAKSILGYGTSYNQLHVVFEENANSVDVIDQIEKVLKPYGFISGTERKDQLGHLMLQDDVDMFEGIGYMFPALFLFVAAMIIYVMMQRIINRQRVLIGVMKALGISEKRILLHYTIYSILIGIVGSVPAVFCGYGLSIAVTSMYNNVVRIQAMQIKIYWSVMILGVALSIVFCILTGFISAKKVLKITPSQAMRPETPTSSKKILIERITFLWNNISFNWKMSIRNIFRNPLRSCFTLIGFILTIVLFMSAAFFSDSVNWVADKQFFEFQKHDYKVTFSNLVSYNDTFDLEKVEGVKKVEPLMEIPVNLKSGWCDEDIIMVGLSKEQTLYKLVDNNFETITLPNKGILLSSVIASRLGVKKGDEIIIESKVGDLNEKKAKVVGIVKQYTGYTCYMEASEMGRFMEEGKFSTSALITVDSKLSDKVHKKLLKYSNIKDITSRIDDYENLKQMLSLVYLFVGIMIMFGCIMGFSSIYNVTVINVTERCRELASLEVLGYTQKEIYGIIIKENLMIGVLSLIPGALIGNAACGVFAQEFSNKLIEIEVVIYPRTYIMSYLFLFLFIILALIANRKNISNLDMIEVLKNKEG